MINGRNSHNKQIQEINGRMPPLPLWSPHLAIRSIHKRQRVEASSASFRHRGRLILHAQDRESPLVGRHSNQQVLVNSLQLTKYMNYLREPAWAPVQETAPSWEWCNARWSKKWVAETSQEMKSPFSNGENPFFYGEITIFQWGNDWSVHISSFVMVCLEASSASCMMKLGETGCRFMAFCHRALTQIHRTWELAVGTRKTSVFGMYQVGTLMYFVCNHQLHKLHKSTNAKVSAPRCTLVTNWCIAHCSQHHSNLALRNCPRRRCANVVPWLVTVSANRTLQTIHVYPCLSPIYCVNYPKQLQDEAPSNYIYIYIYYIRNKETTRWFLMHPRSSSLH